MARPEDHFTNTPEDAAAYERWRASNDYEDFDDGLDLSDVREDDWDESFSAPEPPLTEAEEEELSQES